jgi:hypothetical protein
VDVNSLEGGIKYRVTAAAIASIRNFLIKTECRRPYGMHKLVDFYQRKVEGVNVACRGVLKSKRKVFF